MRRDTLSSSLVLSIGEMHQPPAQSESRAVDEPGVAISVRPENTSEESLVGGWDEAAGLVGPSQWALPPHAPPGDPEAAVASSVVLDLHYYKGSDVASVLPRRIMGSYPPHMRWGNEGDDCTICLGVMAAGEEVSDLTGLNQSCNHTFHLQCVALWLKTKVEAGQKGSCPVCNAEILYPVLVARRQPRAASEVIHEKPPCCALWIMFLLMIVAAVMIALLFTGDMGQQ